MNRKAIIEAILNHLINARKDDAQCVYFGALTAREGSVDWETLGDLVDQLSKR
jgi:hypothetical protein